MILHSGFDEAVRPVEITNSPDETNPPALTESNPPITAEEKREDQFEKALADPDVSSPYHLNVYIRTFLGAMLLLGLITFYIVHISGHGSLGTYGQTNPYPSDVNRLANH